MWKRPVLIIYLLLSACSTGDKPALTPMPQQKPVLEPSDTNLRADMLTFFQGSQAPQSSAYDFKRVDLDGDGMRDALIMMKAPYGYWCDIAGCKMLVLKARAGGFDIVNAIQPTREPVFISKNRTNGWKNIVMRVSGQKTEKAKNVVLRYDGTHYPSTPLNLKRKNFLKIATMERVFER